MRRLCAAVLAACFIVLGAGPAAADDEIGLGWDGIVFGDALDRPLFSPDLRWVPGDVRTETFYVRNRSTDPGRLEISILGRELDDLLDTGDLEVAVRAEGDWASVDAPGRHVLVDRTVAAGAVVPVDVRVSFDPASTNPSQRLDLELDFAVRLEQAGTGTPDASGVLPGTGSAVGVVLLALALTSIGVGAVALRHSKENAHE